MDRRRLGSRVLSSVSDHAQGVAPVCSKKRSSREQGVAGGGQAPEFLFCLNLTLEDRVVASGAEGTTNGCLGGTPLLSCQKLALS